MFKNIFSFKGRIRRLEYGITFLIVLILNIVDKNVIKLDSLDSSIFMIVFLFVGVPIIWFALVQGVKRSHDIGNSGWWLLIPFYSFYIIFKDGQIGINEYGEDPKFGIQRRPSKFKRLVEYNEQEEIKKSELIEINIKIESNPDNPILYNERGIIKDELEDYYGAINDYSKAIDLDNNFVNAFINRGIANLKINNYEEALSNLDNAIRIDNSCALAYYNIGVIYDSKNQKELAIENFKRAVELGYSDAIEVLKDYEG